MYKIMITTALILPSTLFAAGSGDSGAPATTETTTTCKGVMVWSDAKGKCVSPESGALNDDQLYHAARELAYAGEYDATLAILAAMSNQTDDRVLTYKGFVHRKLGEIELGNSYYMQAIARNPDNLLARSYMGQGFVASGDMVAALEQLREIRTRNGIDTWPEVSLRNAIETGATYSY